MLFLIYYKCVNLLTAVVLWRQLLYLKLDLKQTHFFVVSHLPLQLQLWKPCHLVVKATISRKVNSFNLSTFVILMKFDETNWRVDKLNHLLINPCLVSKRLNFFFVFSRSVTVAIVFVETDGPLSTLETGTTTQSLSLF